MNERMPVTQGQWRLAYIWLGGAGVSFAILLAQTMWRKFGDQYDRAWSWFLPTVLPVLTLIVSSLVYQARTNETATVDRRMYQISAAFSVFYLSLVLGVLLSTAFPGVLPLDRMTQAQLWLSPVHALTASALGAFFVSKKE
jgi:cytochrome bd-type quinol oxidase subunit 2